MNSGRPRGSQAPARFALESRQVRDVDIPADRISQKPGPEFRSVLGAHIVRHGRDSLGCRMPAVRAAIGHALTIDEPGRNCCFELHTSGVQIGRRVSRAVDPCTRVHRRDFAPVPLRVRHDEVCADLNRRAFVARSIVQMETMAPQRSNGKNGSSTMTERDIERILRDVLAARSVRAIVLRAHSVDHGWLVTVKSLSARQIISVAVPKGPPGAIRATAEEWAERIKVAAGA